MVGYQVYANVGGQGRLGTLCWVEQLSTEMITDMSIVWCVRLGFLVAG